MSSFTQFNGELYICFDPQATKILGKDHWRVKDSFRYYFGSKDSDIYVDVPAGKLTDGATVPYLFQFLLPVWSDYGQAMVMHDQLCDTYEATRRHGTMIYKVKLTRKEIDEVLVEAMGVLNVAKWRILLIKAGLDIYRFLVNPQGPKPAVAKRALELQYTAQPATPS